MGKFGDPITIGLSFLRGKDEIFDAFRNRSKIQLNAQGPAIEVAISLSEFFINKQRIAIYDKFTSSLTQNQDGQPIPRCSIILKYIGNNQSNFGENVSPNKHQYRERERRDQKGSERDRY